MLHRLSLVCLLTLAFAGTPAAADERPKPADPATAAERKEAWELHRSLEQGSPCQGLAWRSVGPVVQGGRVVDVEAVPGKPFAFYVAYASGGLWYTENNGHTFTPLFDDQPTLIMGDVALDPSDPQRLWVGTGENNSSRSSYGGYGVFRSDDGGATWSAKGLIESDRIGRVQVDPRDGQRVFVAALGKLYTAGGQRGVYRTTDGGDTWVQVLPGGEWTGAIDVQLDPKNPDIVYAATWERRRRPWNFWEGGAGSAIWKSTDGGTTWAQLKGGFPEGADVGRIGLAICQSKPNVIYASVDHQGRLPEAEWDLGGPLSAKRVRRMTTEDFVGHSLEQIQGFIDDLDYDLGLKAKALVAKLESGELTLKRLLDKMSDANASLFSTDIRGLEVYRSDDRGATWRRTHAKPLKRVVHTYGYYFGLIRVAPDDPDRVYVAGVPLLTSGDGGQTWIGIHGRRSHVDYHALWIDPTDSRHLIAGNDGGIDVSFDRGVTWRGVDAQPVGQFYTLAIDDQEPYWIYGGLQDNGTYMGSSRSRPGVDEWERIGGGDGMYVQVDPRDRTIYYGYQFGWYFRRSPEGKSERIRPTYGLEDEPLRYNWATPVHLSPHNADVVYFGCNKLFRSMDQGRTWRAISSDLTTSPNRGDVPFACITSISESPDAFGHVWIGTDDGHVHVTTDGGATWKDRSAGLPRDRWCTRVVASRHDPRCAYATFSGYRDDDITAYVYATKDGGASWTSLAKGLPPEPVNVICEDPWSATRIYVGTDRGVYVSADGGATFEALVGGLPCVPVHDLLVHERAKELVAATHGRSIYVLPLKHLLEVTPEIRAARVHVFSQEALTPARGWLRPRSEWTDRPERHPRRRLVFWAGGGGSAALEILDDEGRVLRAIEAQATPGLNVVEWDLLLDPQKALAAEAAGNAGSPAPKTAAERWTQWPRREAAGMGWPCFVTPATYAVRVTVGDASASTQLVVKPRK